jgi:APA family basic amino acid/polyamine antiporter
MSAKQNRTMLRPWSAIMLIVANMVGTGIFTTTGIIAVNLPNAYLILACWLAGGLIALSGALSYTELSTRMPEAGGEYVYLKKLYHPVVGFLSGWTSFFVGFSAPIAAAAISFSVYVLGHEAHSDPTGRFLASGVILVLTFIHFAGLKTGAAVQNGLTIIKILIIAILATAGLMLVDRVDFVLPVEGLEKAGWAAYGPALLFVMFAYSGWNASTYIATELAEPRKTLQKSLLWGTLAVISLYLLLHIFILSAVPITALQGRINGVEIAAVSVFGPWLGEIFGWLVAVALLSSLSAYIMLGPRVYFAMAKDRLFFAFAGRIHKRYGVPSTAVLLQGAIAIAMILLGTFEQLLVYIGFALSLFPVLAVAGLFIARQRRIGETSVVRVWGYPIVPLFFIVTNILIMYFAFASRPLESLVAIATVMAGIPIYYLVSHKNRRDDSLAEAKPLSEISR